MFGSPNSKPQRKRLVSGSPGGSNTQIQYNNSGSFGGDANLTWNKTTLTISNGTVINSTSLMVGNVGSMSVTNASIIVGNSTVNTTIISKGVIYYANTYANLPSSPVIGTTTIVTDANVNTWGSTVSIGGNSHIVRVFYNGSVWVIG